MTRDDFIEYLFHNGAGMEATRLVLVVDHPDPYLDIGGWSKVAIAAKVDEMLKAERVACATEAQQIIKGLLESEGAMLNPSQVAYLAATAIREGSERR